MIRAVRLRSTSRVAFLLAGLTVSTACALIETQGDDDDVPTVTITVLEGSRAGEPCDTVVNRGEGLPPDDAVRVAKLRLAADRPVPPRVLDDVAREWCIAHCVNGYHLLRAEEVAGGGRTSIDIWTFRTVP